MRKLIIVLAGILALFVFIQNSIIADTDSKTLTNTVPSVIDITNTVNASVMQ